MNQREYLDALAVNLESRCSAEQKDDILRDYSEFFQNGLEDGKSEEQLAAEFGPPKQAAAELLAGRGGFADSHPGVLGAVLGGLVTVALLAAAWFSLKSPDGFNVWAAVLFPLLFQGVLTLHLKTGARKRPSDRSRKRFAAQGILFVFCAAVLCFEGYEVVFAEDIAGAISRTGGTPNLPMTLLPYAAGAAAAALIASGVLAFLSAGSGHEKTRWILFADTAVFTILVNFTATLSYIGTPYDGVSSAVTDVLAALLPSLAAAAVFLALRRTAAFRSKKV